MKNNFIVDGLMIEKYGCDLCDNTINYIDSCNIKYFKKKLPWETIARTCAPADAVKAVIEHTVDIYNGNDLSKADIVFKDKDGNFCVNNDGCVYIIPYGPASQTPEQEINIERIGE